MVPFRVQCETCQSWLKVARESLVGQIHSCPKCGAMVHLTPPPEAPQASGDAPIGKHAAASAVVAAASNAKSSDAFDAIDNLGLDGAAARAVPIQPPPTNAVARSPVEAFGNKLAIGVGAAGATLIVFGAVAYWLLGDGAPTTQVATVAQPAPAAATPPAEPDAALPLAVADTEGPDASPPSAAEQPERFTPELPPLPDERDIDAQPEDAPPPPAPSPATPEPAAGVEPREQAAPAAAPPSEAGFDPLEFDPAKLDLVMVRGERAGRADPAPAGAEQPGDNDVRLPTIGAAGAAPIEDQLDGRLEERAKEERVWVERGETAFESHQPVDLARRLAEKLPELRLPSAPLAYSVRLWSELAGAPVTIDPAALARAGVGPNTKMGFNGADQTLAELLREGLRPLRLGYAERDGQLVVARLGGETAKTAAYSVDDLLSGAPDAGELRDLAAALVPSTAGAGALRADGAQLRLDAPANAHYDLAVFCERLRLARGLPQRTKYPAALLEVRPPLAGLEAPLSRTATFSFVTPTPLADLFDHWRHATGLEILVDWASASAADLGPRSLVRCSARDQSWRDAMDGVLGPLGLGWRAVDARTIQIASAADAARGVAALEFYPLRPDADGASAAEQLSHACDSLAVPTVVRFDEPSATLLILACDENHRFAYDWLLRQGLVAE